MDTSRAVANAERYQHIATAEIIKLFDQGLSFRRIGKKLDMGPSAVRNHLIDAGKRYAAKKVTDSQLKEVRLDPAWEARIENRPIVSPDRVVCRECGELKSELNANGNHSHLRGKHHNMTAQDYKSKHPGARLVSFARSADQNRRQGRTKSIEDLMDEFAALYLRPKELKAFQKDEEYEEHHDIEDFVACRIARCGLKSKTHLYAHLKRHGLTPAAYRKLFPKALHLPLGLYDAKAAIARTYSAKKREQWKKLLADAPQAKQRSGRGRQRDKDTDRRIELAAKLSLQGKSLSAMSTEVYPEKKHTPETAYERLRKLVSDYRPQFNAAKQRLQSSVK